MKYKCPRCGSGEYLSMLYYRKYSDGDRSGRFMPLVLKGLRLAHCGNCGTVTPAAKGGKRAALKKKQKETKSPI